MMLQEYIARCEKMLADFKPEDRLEWLTARRDRLEEDCNQFGGSEADAARLHWLNSRIAELVVTPVGGE